MSQNTIFTQHRFEGLQLCYRAAGSGDERSMREALPADAFAYIEFIRSDSNSERRPSNPERFRHRAEAR